MLNTQPLDSVPLWGVYLLTVALLFIAMELGYRVSLWQQRRRPDRAEAGAGTMVGASLAFLGFLLAFIVGVGVNLTTQRRSLVVAEANAIGTAYLRAGFLDEEPAAYSHKLLREYVGTRLAALEPGKLAASIARGEEIHQELWTVLTAQARTTPTPIVALYASALNDVIDLHSERVNAQLEVRIPPALLWGLYGVAALTLLLIGLQSGYSGKRSLVAISVTILILSTVFMLISDLERSSQGFIQVSQAPLISLQQQLEGQP